MADYWYLNTNHSGVQISRSGYSLLTTMTTDYGQNRLHARWVTRTQIPRACIYVIYETCNIDDLYQASCVHDYRYEHKEHGLARSMGGQDGHQTDAIIIICDAQ